MIKLKFIKSGLQTTLQDMGRSGYQNKGVPVSGALDQHSYILANTLVNNDLNAPVLEATLMGPVIRFDGPCEIAITGANLSPSINGLPIRMNLVKTIETGDVLKFGKPIQGVRSYIAISGKWDVPLWLGSCSPLLNSHDAQTIRGWIKKDDEICISPERIGSSIQINQPNDLLDCNELTVLPGPEFDWFSSTSIAQFFSQQYTVTQDSDRMGYRLKGSPIYNKEKRSMISSGIIPGTVQIANDGLPIVIMRDGQSIGGYPRMANLTESSINVLAQTKPGDTIRFVFKPYL